MDTDVRGNPLPPPFECVICERETRPDPWHVHEHQPPICRYCSVRGGHQCRIPGMTRGDHHKLQRLVAVTNALRGTANWEAYRGRVAAK